MPAAVQTTTEKEYLAAQRRVVYAFAVLSCVLGIGAAGYRWIGWHHDLADWTLRECLYMTAITISTVGFSESLDVAGTPGAREWTMVLIVFGISANLWVISSITSFFVEGDFTHLRRYRRLAKHMNRLKDHYIVCGVGSTGVHVARELVTVGNEVVVVDANLERLDQLSDTAAVPLRGDATDDLVLEQAGLARARGLVATLDDDKNNLFLVLSARQVNPRLRIVAKAVEKSTADKLRRAGADVVVSPSFIGGMRLASELVRPVVVRFLDDMLRGRGEERSSLRIEEARVASDGAATGQTLAQAKLPQKTGALVIAVRGTDGDVRHAPPADHPLTAGETLILIGEAPQVSAVRQLVGNT